MASSTEMVSSPSSPVTSYAEANDASTNRGTVVATKTPSRVPLSPGENLAVGAFGGAFETCLQMPILTYKFCLQEGRARPQTIPGWYRGVGVQAGTVAPITAIQFCVNGILQKAIRIVRTDNGAGAVTAVDSNNSITRPLTDGEMMISAAGAGAISALVYSPVDLMTIQQQKLEQNVLQTARTIWNQYGLTGLYRGLCACAIRESVYTAGYLGLAPVLSAHLVQDIPSLSERPFSAGVLGACLAGTTAAVLTHPVDTAKTCMQSDMNGTMWVNARQIMPKLVQQGGLASLFRGLAPRTVRLCGAFFVCMTLQDRAMEYKTNAQKRNNGF